MSASAPIALRRDGHTTRLKWHRARRRASDPPFTARRIVEGMRAGASVEIDLVLNADRGCTVLHDRFLNTATTGTGAIADTPATTLRTLCLRDNDAGVLEDQHVLLLDDLAGLLTDMHPDAMLQLDFKESAADLDDVAVAAFAEAVTPFAGNALLSCGDAEAVRILTDAVPALHVGYDPCHHGAVDRVLRWRTYRRFVDAAIEASPRAEVIYLDRRLVFTCADRGFDLIAAFHARDREIDVYTLGRADDPDIDRALALRADQITTDDADGVIAARR
ncbi:glycerophosphodiester phosphodiesterase [Gordonia sp. NPDC003504]